MYLLVVLVRTGGGGRYVRHPGDNLPYPVPLLRGGLSVTRPPSPAPGVFPLAMVLLYYIVPNISIYITHKYCTRYMCIMYIVPDRQMCYNNGILEEVSTFHRSPGRRQKYASIEGPTEGSQ